jgi:hypothetical protein
MAIAVAHRSDETKTEGFAECLPFEAIQCPGCYICNWSGHLLRVPEEAVSRFRRPHFSLNARGRLFVTRISNNPYETVTKARELAEACNVQANF